MMITKRQLCETVIENHFGDISLFNEERILESSKVAVAAEYLGLLTTEEYIQYASSRSGIIDDNSFFDGDTKCPLTFREILSLLPESIN